MIFSPQFQEIFFPTDSYKFSHFYQYPQKTSFTHFYLEARSAKRYDHVYFFGLQYYLSVLDNWKKYLEQISQAEFDNIEKKIQQHGLTFNKKGFLLLQEYIKKNNKLPLSIHSVPENRLYDIGTTLLTVENCDATFFWLPSFVETLLLKVWYPSTVATKSYNIKLLLEKFWNDTSVNALSGVDFQFHNFGDRGSSTVETAFLGGLAHLQIFKGSDNFMSCLNDNNDLIGFSIPAMEHATINSWGKSNEFQSYENM